MTKGLLNSFRHLSKLRRSVAGKPDDHDDVRAFKRYRNLYNRQIRAAKSSHYGNMLNAHKGDISKIWQTLNYLIGKSHDKTSCTTMKIDDVPISDTTVISDKFCEFFTTVGSKCASKILPARVPYSSYLNIVFNRSFFLDPVIPGDIINIIGHLKTKKSSGKDKITTLL